MARIDGIGTHSAGGDRKGPLRVLLVDDDWALLETTSALLSDFDVATASSGAEALKKLRKLGFDVVCSDLCMPGFEGDELLAQVLEFDPNTGVVLVTGATERLDAARRKAGRSYSVIAKPYDPDEIIKAIKREGRLARMRRSVSSARDQQLPPSTPEREP